MKHIFSFYICFQFFSFNCFAQNVAALDAKYGFNDAKFGMHPSAFRGLKFNYRTGNSIVHYDRKPFMVGDIQLSFIQYTFIFDKLTNIEFGSEAANCQELIKIMRLAYGNPNSTKFGDRWIGQRVNMLWIDVDSQKVFFRIELNNHDQLWRQAAAFDKSELTKKRLQGL